MVSLAALPDDPVLNGAMFFNRLCLEFLAINYREERH